MKAAKRPHAFSWKNAFDVIMKNAKHPGAFAFGLVEDTEDLYETEYENYKHLCDTTLISAMEKLEFCACEQRTLIESKYKPKEESPLISQMPGDTSCKVQSPSEEPSQHSYIYSLTVCYSGDVKKEEEYKLQSQTLPSPIYWKDEGVFPSEYEYNDDSNDHKRILGFVVTFSDGVQVEIGDLKRTCYEATMIITGHYFDFIRSVEFYATSREDDYHISYISEDNAKDSSSSNNIVQDDYDPEDKNIFHQIYVETEEGTCFLFEKGKLWTVSGGTCGSFDKNQVSNMVTNKLRKILQKKNHHSKEALRQYNKDMQRSKERRWQKDEYPVPQTMKHDKNMKNTIQFLDNANRKRLFFEYCLEARLGQNVYITIKSAEEKLWETFLTPTRRIWLNEINDIYSIYRNYAEMRHNLSNIFSLDEEEEDSILLKTSELLDGIRFHFLSIDREYKMLCSNRKKAVQILSKNPYIDNYKKYAAKRYDEENLIHGTKRGTSVCHECLSPFRPAQVRSRKRCSIPECFDSYQSKYNCGCLVWDCPYCGDQFCKKHRKAHKCILKTSISSRCGWMEEGKYLKKSPFHCGSKVSKNLSDAGNSRIYTCSKCHVICCGNCLLRCPGKDKKCPSNTSWCGKCDPLSGYSSYCDECYEIESIGEASMDSSDEEYHFSDNE